MTGLSEEQALAATGDADSDVAEAAAAPEQAAEAAESPEADSAAADEQADEDEDPVAKLRAE